MQIVLNIIPAAITVFLIAIVIKGFLEEKKNGKPTTKLGRVGIVVASIVMLIFVIAAITIGVFELINSTPSDDPWENARME